MQYVKKKPAIQPRRSTITTKHSWETEEEYQERLADMKSRNIELDKKENEKKILEDKAQREKDMVEYRKTHPRILILPKVTPQAGLSRAALLNQTVAQNTSEDVHAIELSLRLKQINDLTEVAQHIQDANDKGLVNPIPTMGEDASYLEEHNPMGSRFMSSLYTADIGAGIGKWLYENAPKYMGRYGRNLMLDRLLGKLDIGKPSTEYPYLTYYSNGKNRIQTNFPERVTFNYTGPQHSVKEVINSDGSINVDKLMLIELDVNKQTGGTSTLLRRENSEWHPTDFTTFLHTRDAVGRALQAGYNNDLLFAVLMHDAGKTVAGEGHGPIGANIVKQVFPDATLELITAIAEHMDAHPATSMGKAVKGADIAEPNEFRNASENISNKVTQPEEFTSLQGIQTENSRLVGTKSYTSTSFNKIEDLPTETHRNETGYIIGKMNASPYETLWGEEIIKRLQAKGVDTSQWGHWKTTQEMYGDGTPAGIIRDVISKPRNVVMGRFGDAAGWRYTNNGDTFIVTNPSVTMGELGHTALHEAVMHNTEDLVKDATYGLDNHEISDISDYLKARGYDKGTAAAEEGEIRASVPGLLNRTLYFNTRKRLGLKGWDKEKFDRITPLVNTTIDNMSAQEMSTLLQKNNGYGETYAKALMDEYNGSNGNIETLLNMFKRAAKFAPAATPFVFAKSKQYKKGGSINPKLTNQFTFPKSQLDRNQLQLSTKKDMRKKMIKSDRPTYLNKRIRTAKEGMEFASYISPQELELTLPEAPTLSNPFSTETYITNTYSPKLDVEDVTTESPIEIPVTDLLPDPTESQDDSKYKNMSFYDLVKQEKLPLRITSDYRAGAKTRSGHISNHSRKDTFGNSMAYDIQPVINGKIDKSDQAFQVLLKALITNPNVLKWMKAHGYGILDETTASMMAKTGATGKHYHIGPDSIARAQYNSLLSKYGIRMGANGMSLEYAHYISPEEQEIEMPEAPTISDPFSPAAYVSQQHTESTPDVDQSYQQLNTPSEDILDNFLDAIFDRSDLDYEDDEETPTLSTPTGGVSAAMLNQIKIMESGSANPKSLTARREYLGNGQYENWYTGPFGMTRHFDIKGHPVVKQGDHWTLELANRNLNAFYTSMANKWKAVLNGKNYTQDQLDALCSISASGNWASPTGYWGKFVVKNWGDWKTITDKWKKIGITSALSHGVLPGLVKRRTLEANWFMGKHSKFA